MNRDRFFAKVREDVSGCHLWTGARNVWGYGRLHVGGKMLAAHRVAWELANGPIPDGMWVLHHCDVRDCVNPAHLYLGTHRQNVRDMIERGRHPSARHFPRADSRIEIRLTPERRQELSELAAEIGISTADIARLAIHQLLHNRDGRLHLETPHGQQGAPV
jgi:hypothetical protein